MFPTHLVTKTQELFPHVVEKLILLWSDHSAVDSYLWSLIVNDQAKRTRAGFPYDVVDELLAVARYIEHDCVETEVRQIVKGKSYHKGQLV